MIPDIQKIEDLSTKEKIEYLCQSPAAYAFKIDELNLLIKSYSLIDFESDDEEVFHIERIIKNLIEKLGSLSLPRWLKMEKSPPINLLVDEK